MAIYHLTAKVISRGKGQSAIAAAAYRSGERLVDKATGEVKEYRARSERILFAGIFTPANAPEWAHDRNELWNEAEQAERRKDAQLAREIEVALPHELTDQQRLWLVQDFVREEFTRKGYAVDVAIHQPEKDADQRNFHAHLLVTMRTLGPDGFAETKDRSLNNREQLAEWREDWAHLCNRHLERHGHEARIDHRSNEARGIEAEPTKHEGYQVAQMVERGEKPDRFLENEEIRTRNAGLQIKREWVVDELTLDKEAGSGGMVAQQGAALEWVIASDQERRQRQQEDEKKHEAEKPATIENSKTENSDVKTSRLGSDKAREKSDRDRALDEWFADRRAGRGDLERERDDGGREL